MVVPKLLRLPEVAERTGIQLWRLYELIAKGEWPPHMRVGRTIRLKKRRLNKRHRKRMREKQAKVNMREQLGVTQAARRWANDE